MIEKNRYLGQRGYHRDLSPEQTTAYMKRYQKFITSVPNSREKCLDFLVKAGITDSRGKLSPDYR